MRLSLYFPFEPRPKQSARFSSKNGRMFSYQPKKVADYKAQLAYAFIAQVGPGFVPYAGQVFVERLWYVFPMPSTMKKADKLLVDLWEKDPTEKPPVYKQTRPDLTDNLSKGLFDALTGLLYVDDSQIVSMTNAMKVFGTKPRTELIVELL